MAACLILLVGCAAFPAALAAVNTDATRRPATGNGPHGEQDTQYFVLVVGTVAVSSLTIVLLASMCCAKRRALVVQPLGREGLRRLRDTKVPGHPRLQNAAHDMYQAYITPKHPEMTEAIVGKLIREVCSLSTASIKMDKGEHAKVTRTVFREMDIQHVGHVNESNFRKWTETTCKELETSKETLLISFPLHHAFLCALETTIKMQIVGCGPFPVDESFTSRPLITLTVDG